jgi:hypothetical protein
MSFKKDDKVEVKVFEPDKYKGQFEDYFCHYFPHLDYVLLTKLSFDFVKS